MSTPEGRVKGQINKMLRTLPADRVWVTRPVPYGYGESSLDFLGCVKTAHGTLFFAIEAKRPGAMATAREALLIERLKAMGAVIFVVDGTDDTDTVEAVEAWLRMAMATVD
jgi:hypothetical protein